MQFDIYGFANTNIFVNFLCLQADSLYIKSELTGDRIG